MFSYKGKTILITGGTGSWGTELVQQLLKKGDVKEIRIFSRGEFQQTEMKRRFNNHPKLNFFIGDVRDLNRLLLVTKGVDYIFHLAALKHVPVCENHPTEAVQTNIAGTSNVIEAALINKAGRVIYAASDKGVDPINLYGITKACAERLIVAANKLGDTKFICVRGGNIIETRGSVIPLFYEQIKNHNLITLTDYQMTRFFISLPEIIGFILAISPKAYGGEVFVPKAKSAAIKNLAELMIGRFGDKKTGIKVIGSRAGEKIHELLVSKNEAGRTFDMGDYFVVLPPAAPKRIFRFYENKGRSFVGEFASAQDLITGEKALWGIFKDSSILSGVRREKTGDLIRYFENEDWETKKTNSDNRRKR